MKKDGTMQIALLCVTLAMLSGLIGFGDRLAQAVTNIVLTDGTDSKIADTIKFSNISTVGRTTELVTNPLRFAATNGRIQWNTDHLEFSNNGGSTYTNFLALPSTNATTFTFGSGASTGTIDINFASYTGLRYDIASGKVQFYDSVWKDIGSGSGTSYILTSADHTNTFLNQTKTGQFTQLNSTTFQISAFAKFTDLTTAENILHRIEAGYSCTMMKFGKDATDHLFYTQGTAYADPCVVTTYTTTATLSAAQQNRWVEYAVQVNQAGNITFYVDGLAFDTQAMTTAMAAQATANETLRLYEGWEGSGGAVKIGTLISWPTSGWKGIDTEMNTFPGAVFVLPLTETGESVVVDTIGNVFLAKDADVTWGTLRGGF
jgi:hypothetical protein